MRGTRSLQVASVGMIALGVAAGCGSGGGAGSSTVASRSGGTLTYFEASATQHLDPQRTYVGRDLSNLSRLVYRQLVAFPTSTDPAVADKPVPDLATDTGTPSDHAKTWQFTIKDDVKWQDGSPITCEDFKYGASRVFATSVITGGPNYILTYLNVPTDPKTGLPAYKGPYTTKNNDVASFNKAITCNGRTITYHFKKPWPDFPLAVAALAMMDPYKKAVDQGDKSDFQVFSDGPYKLQGSYDPKTGGTFVRNPSYDPKTDSPDIRKALPDRVVFDVGKTVETIAQLLISDSGAAKSAVTGDNIPPSFYGQVNGAVAERAVDVKSPYVDYLAPNFQRLRDPLVRKALAMATNTQGWIIAGGGARSYSPADSIVNPAVVGYRPNPAFTKIPPEGDPAAAKALLQKAGVKLPYPLTFTYESTATYDKQAAALKQTWDQAGFKTTLDGVANQNAYYTDIQKASQSADIVWAGWGADWPSADTVVPPMFDSRPNLTPTGNGQDYGRYKSDAFNKLVDEAQGASTLSQQTKALQQADTVLGRDYAYIPLEIQKLYLLHGSQVTGYKNTPASSMYPDLGSIGVSQ